MTRLFLFRSCPNLALRSLTLQEKELQPQPRGAQLEARDGEASCPPEPAGMRSLVSWVEGLGFRVYTIECFGFIGFSV